MRSNFKLLTFLCLIAGPTYAQNDQSPSLILGDPVPALRVHKWLKGKPVERFEKGRIYVVEFWATWCQPCIAAMPHLSNLALKYQDRVTVIGIDILENKTTSLEKIKTFVYSMGNRMDYHVAAQESNFMEVDWYKASGELGIPKSFVVNGEGKLAWIGHPMDLDKILPKVINNTWDIKIALAERKELKRLDALDDSLRFELNMYAGDAYNQDYIGKPNSALLLINEMVKKEPKLKYRLFVASHTFASLLKTDPQRAYEYGKELLAATSNYDDPPYYSIIDNIKWYSDKINLPANIYLLGAEAYQARIDRIPYPEIFDMPKHYKQMAEWYWRANDKPKAIEGMQKGIEALKSKKDFSSADLAAFESQLRQYKNM
jgi:thiol-disulfide isomerase/thioredoxin